MIARWRRRVLGLPEARAMAEPEPIHVPMRDGVRLQGVHVWPVGAEERAPTILIRSAEDPHTGPLGAKGLASELASCGYHVIVQSVRGRNDSEGCFDPFVSESRDGRDSVSWIRAQAWHGDRLGAFGAGYAGSAALALIEGEAEGIDAAVVAVAAREPRRVFRPGDALAFAHLLEWSARMGERSRAEDGALRLLAALGHRPLIDADRVAHQRLPWFADFVEGEAHWAARTPAATTRAIPLLFIGADGDPATPAMLDDYAQMRALAEEQRVTRPALVLGPWPDQGTSRLLPDRASFEATLLRAAIRHFDHHLRGGAHEQHTSVDVFVRCGRAPGGYHEGGDRWPPADTRLLQLHLRNGEAGLSLSEGSSDGAEPDGTLRADPRDPVPSGECDQLGPDERQALGLSTRSRSGRQDVLAYVGDPLDTAMRLRGRLLVDLHASFAGADADFAAALYEATPGGGDEPGTAILIAEGIVRQGSTSSAGGGEAESDGWETRRMRIDLGHVARDVERGHVLRLEISGTRFPRFASRSTEADVRRIHHGGSSGSILSVEIRP